MTACLVLDGSSVPPAELVGGKAHGIALMRAAGLPVPPAVVLTTDLCRAYHQHGDAAIQRVWPEVLEGLHRLEQETGRTFGGGSRPLLVSVRSGAALSMPGMMDTLLNVGLTRAAFDVLAAADKVFARDVRDRLKTSYRQLVLQDEQGQVPDDAYAQLRLAVEAVLQSWGTARAQTYRRHYDLDDTTGTAVTVQAMVFGNLDDSSASGVLFSRDPLTGADEPVGEWLPRAQGEDVVSGRFDPLPLRDLALRLPDVHRELLRYAQQLETQRRDVQDIEFTVESGRLWLLQTRAVKRSAAAALRFAVDLCGEGLISQAEAVQRVSDEQLSQLSGARLNEEQRAGQVLATGDPVSPGVASGVVVLDSDEAEERANAGEQVVLLRATTSPDDLHAMIAAAAIVTAVGGATSHAALVSREIGKPCIVGVGVDALALLDGLQVTVDADAGLVLAGEVLPQRAAEVDPRLRRLQAWRDAVPVA